MKSFLIAALGAALILRLPAFAQYETYETATHHIGETGSNSAHVLRMLQSHPRLTDGTITNWNKTERSRPDNLSLNARASVQSQAELGGPG